MMLRLMVLAMTLAITQTRYVSAFDIGTSPHGTNEEDVDSTSKADKQNEAFFEQITNQGNRALDSRLSPEAESLSLPSASPTTPMPTHKTRKPTTMFPSKDPTSAPTPKPRKPKPTVSPTLFPTVKTETPGTMTPTITNYPTLSPVPMPTIKTHKPTTPRPTKVQTPGPTKRPTTGRPTRSVAPSMPRPTSGPTVSPVISPSSSPSTSRPSVTPSSTPSTTPSVSPSSTPSRAPTLSPSHAPSSSAPSTSPTTTRPSRTPSRAPSTSRPSSSPSRRPTSSRPSRSPSKLPTTSKPSFAPSTSSPSHSPSRRPSTSLPSHAPSHNPSTSRPSTRPTTSRPSLSPSTSRPSRSPTRSARPSNAPTNRPTLQPTTAQPTISPTTAAPTFSPTTSRPSMRPTTSRPTKNPTTSRPSRQPTTSRPTRSPSTRSPTLLSQAPSLPPRRGPILTLSSPGFLYVADPNAMVVNDKIYLFCSTDPPNAGASTQWNNMRAYSLLTTTTVEQNVPWQNYGMVVRPDTQFPQYPAYQNKLMFAPGASYNDGWFYLYFPFLVTASGSASIGIARSKTPEVASSWVLVVPLVPGLNLFDPAVMQTPDGNAYLYGNSRDATDGASTHKMLGVQLNSDLATLDSTNAPGSQMTRLYGGTVTEAVFVFYRPLPATGELKYYFFARSQTASHDCLFYWMADDPMPRILASSKGVQMTPDQYDAPAHASIIEFKSRYYIFYHSGLINNGNKWRRSTCMDEVYFNADGTIVAPIYLSCPIQSTDSR